MRRSSLDAIGDLILSFAVFFEAYLRQVSWEDRDRIEARTAELLPILFLARVDGKSPVEYFTEERYKELVRRTAYLLLRNLQKSFCRSRFTGTA